MPRSWQGKTIRTLDVRNAFHVNIIAVRKASSPGTLNVAPGADCMLEAGDNVVAVGRGDDIDRLHEVR